ncbi:MAG: polysaccharide pyruvyl transferase family protein [Pseudomonadota bacterium]
MQQSIIIAGETYSPNIGDGVIAECLRYLFKQTVPGLRVHLLDISGRDGWPEAAAFTPTQNRRRVKLPSVRQLIGSRAVNVTRWTLLHGRQARARWPSQLQDAAALVIGGGLLIMDNNLGFPLKLSTLVKVAGNQNVPIHFAACGVGDNRRWSTRGQHLLHQALSSAQTVTLRDTISQQKLAELAPDVIARLTMDPAVFARDVFGLPKGKIASPVVGLGVMHVEKVNAYNAKKPELSPREMCDFWLELATLLLQQGIQPKLFCNGSEQDWQFAHYVARQAQQQCGLELPVAPRPTRPAQLAHTIASMRGVVVFRLHASIIATAYGIPSVGLAWDAKVPAFYAETNRDDLCFSPHECTPGGVAAALHHAMAEGIEPDALAEWKARARSSVTVPLRATGIEPRD